MKRQQSQAQKFLVLSSKINPTCDNNALIDQEANQKRISTQFPCRAKERRNKRSYLVQIRTEKVSF